MADILMWLVWSDLHLDKWKAFATITEQGLNSRLVEQHKIIAEMMKIARRNKVSAIFFLGDLFNNQSESISKIIYNFAFYLIQSVAKIAPVYLLTGNHDLFNNIHCFQPFTSIANVSVINNETTIKLDGKTVDLIPWVVNDSGKVPDKKGDYCFAHFGIQGANIANGFTVEEAVSPELLKDYKIVLSGHFHTRQQLGEHIWHTGAIMAHSFKDTTEDRGIWLVDPATDAVSFIVIKSPKFITLTFFSQEQLDSYKFNDYDYYRLLLKNDGIHAPELSNVITEFEYEEESDVENVDTTDIVNLIPIIQEFIDKSNTQLDKEVLKSKAVELLEV